VASRNKVSDARIADTAQNVRGAIGRMVIDDDYIEFEIGALSEGASYGIQNRALAISNRYDDAGL